MNPQHDRKTYIANSGRSAQESVTRHRAGEHPPCFETLSQYRRWLAQNKLAPVPARDVFPREPNYCHDCTAGFQADAIKRRVCLFPAVWFEERTEPSFGREPAALKEILPPRSTEIVGYEAREGSSRRRDNPSLAKTVLRRVDAVPARLPQVESNDGQADSGWDIPGKGS